MPPCSALGPAGEHRRRGPASARPACPASPVSEQPVQRRATHGMATAPGNRPGERVRCTLHERGSMGTDRGEARERTRRRGRRSSEAGGCDRLRHEDRNRPGRAAALREGGAAGRKDTRPELPLLPA